MLPDQLRSTSFRLGAAYATLFLVSMMALLAITYVAATWEVEGIVRRSVSEDVVRFEAIAATGGATALRRAVEERSEAATEDHFYLMLDEAGSFVAGNLPAVVWNEGWSERKLRGDVVAASEVLRQAAELNSDREVRLFSNGVRIGGDWVMAARNSHILDETQEIILGVLLWGSIGTTLLALVGGYFISLGPTRRVDAIAAAMRSVATGKLERRLPVSARRDELDRLSSDINQMLDKIEALMSSLKQVSTDIAHDLRTPLSRLRQRLEGLQTTASSVDELKDELGDAVGEVDAIIVTFNALLRIAQIEAGARRAKFRRIDLSELLAEMHEAFETVAEDAGHVLSLDAAPGLFVEGDRDLLQQLFANLVENAITHVPPPGSIRLYAGIRQEGPRRSVVCGVGDDGPGVPESERRHIFRRLYRLDRSRTTPGNGLGLAMVAAVAELHDASYAALDGNPGLRIEVAFEASSDGKADV